MRVDSPSPTDGEARAGRLRERAIASACDKRRMKKSPAWPGIFLAADYTAIKPATQNSCEKRMPKVRGWVVTV
jgi:hypothetical protein